MVVCVCVCVCVYGRMCVVCVVCVVCVYASLIVADSVNIPKSTISMEDTSEDEEKAHKSERKRPVTPTRSSLIFVLVFVVLCSSLKLLFFFFLPFHFNFIVTFSHLFDPRQP